MDTPDPPSRRAVLAAVAGVGGLYGGASVARGALGLDAVSFTDQREITQQNGPTLRVEWVALYNGERIAGTGFEDGGGDAPAGPAVALSNLLPGDTGALVIRLTVPTGEPGPAEVTASLALTGNAENGINEPESTAGDTTTGEDGGELADALAVEVWYDRGAAGVDGLGTRNGTREPGEPLVAPDAEGSLREVASALSGGVVLDPASSGPACLRPGESVSVAVGWSLAPETANAVQTDSVDFGVGFTAERCAGGGP
ncbi:hypothetical protein [Salinirubrum litoreum]|uniref:SipW-cognate class signal peptide n=1 Tax=Salinirubrum litoreum TaxID=1126234 RepID=A0ABD5R8V7_9EURY|nr:hypothetical protein [Salinirubrum litoreum]